MTIELLKAEELTHSLQNEVANLYRQLNADNKQRPLNEILRSNNNAHVILCKLIVKWWVQLFYQPTK